MKKFRKAIVALLAMAMVIGCLTVQASAAEGTDNGAYYIVGSMNGWSTSTAPAMTKNGSVYTYEYDLDSAGTVEFKIIENQGADWANVTYTFSNDGNNFSKAAGQPGTVRVTFDVSLLAAEKWWDAAPAVTITGTAFDVQATVADVYNVKGSLADTDWDPATTMGLMSDAGDGTHVVTFADVDAGTYKYKILQDAATYQWANAYISGTADNDGNGTVEVAEDGSSVKFIINTNSKEVTVVVTAPQTGSDSDTGNTGSGSGSDSDAGNTGSGTGSDSDAGNTGSGSDSDAGNTGTGSDSDAGNTGSGSDSDAGNTGSGSDSDAGNTGSGSDTDNNNDNTGNGGTGTDTDTGVSNAVVVACAVVMLAAVVAVIASKKRVTE